MDRKQEFITNVLYYGIILVFVYLGLKFLLPILLPFVIAFVIVWLWKQLADRLAAKLKLSRNKILTVLLTLFYVSAGYLIFRLSAQVIPVLGNLLLQIPTIYEEQILPAFQAVYAKLDDTLMKASPHLVKELESSVSQMLSSTGEFISDSSGSILKVITGYAVSIPSVTVKIIITIVSSYFIAGDYDHVVGFVNRWLPEKWANKITSVAEHGRHVIFIFLRSYSLLMSITFIELFIGLSLLKIPFAAVLALMIAIFDILPVLGTGGILVPWAIIAAILGNFGMAAGITVLYLIITVVRNTLEPRVVGKQIGLHPLATLISMFLGAGMFGVAGLFGFPLALSMIVRMKTINAVEVEKVED